MIEAFFNFIFALVILSIIARFLFKALPQNMGMAQGQTPSREAKGLQGEWAVCDVVNRLGLTALHDVIVPTPDGRLTQIDHLIRLPFGIAVVETKNFSGIIHAFDFHDDDEWVQEIGGEFRRFGNPIHQNQYHVWALRAHIPPTVPTYNVVTFVGSARFHSVPDAVLSLHELELALKAPMSPYRPEEVQAAWQVIERVARTDPSARAAHLAQFQ